jgi:hypothetical protein
MSGKLDWRRARLAGKPNLDHRHEFEFEDRAARWLRRADERRQRERRSVTPSRSCSSRLRICAASVGRHGDSLASTSLTSGANSNDNALRPVPLVLTNTLPFGQTAGLLLWQTAGLLLLQSRFERPNHYAQCPPKSQSTSRRQQHAAA